MLTENYVGSAVLLAVMALVVIGLTLDDIQLLRPRQRTNARIFACLVAGAYFTVITVTTLQYFGFMAGALF